MRIRGNWISLLSWRALSSANNQVETSHQRLSSGLRINSAKDDAPGLSMSHRFLSQVRGLVQASRNALDGISLVNTAEGALQEIHSILHRLRELSLQAANGTLTTSDRQSIQTEANQLQREIDRISEATSFNGRNILNPSGNSALMVSVLEGLRGGWLEQAEQVINANFGLFGDGSTLTVQFINGGDARDAWIDGTPDINGRLTNLTLNINLDKFQDGGMPDGGIAPYFSDRKIARVLANAMLARQSAYTSANFKDWLKSGLGDYIAGGDDLVNDAIAEVGSLANVVAAFGTPWVDDTVHRAAAYLAIKFLHDSAGSPMASLLFELKAGTVNQAFDNFYGANLAAFEADFLLLGEAWASGGGVDLTDSDVGGIGGGTDTSVIPNSGTYSLTPLGDFDMVWPDSSGQTTEFILQVGANEGETITVTIPEVTRISLGLVGTDLINRPDDAIAVFGTAIGTVSSIRGYLGSMTNRLQHTVSGNDQSSEQQLGSYSRIVDLDMAQELAQLTRGQILLSSSSAMMAQANNMRQHVMWLLKDLSFGGIQKPSPLWGQA